MLGEQELLPIGIGEAPVTGIHCSVVAGLRDYYGLEKRPVTIICPYQMLGNIDPDLKEVMGIDTDHIWSNSNMFGTSQAAFKEWKTPWNQEVLISKELEMREFPDGDFYVYAQGDLNFEPSAHMPGNSYFFDATNRQQDFNEENLDWRDNTEEFSLVTEQQLADYKTKLSLIDPDKWIMANFGGTAIGDISLVPATQLKQPKGIRDITEWYMSSLLRPDYLKQVFSYQVEIALENLQRIHQVVGNIVDSVYVCGADFGTQNGPICSPETYRELYKPYHKIINNWIHEHTNWKTFKHSCGGVEPFIEDFIDAGFDILNPIQWTAGGMDIKLIKEKYGSRICFWGGGVDTQKTLPFGTPEAVEKEVLETCRILHKHGKFVFSTVHNIQALTPVENVVAMIQAVKTYNNEWS